MDIEMCLSNTAGSAGLLWITSILPHLILHPQVCAARAARFVGSLRSGCYPNVIQEKADSLGRITRNSAVRGWAMDVS